MKFEQGRLPFRRGEEATHFNPAQGHLVFSAIRSVANHIIASTQTVI